MSRSKTRFKACSAVAHSKLLGMFPGIKLSQTQHLLASALGHNTYQSFRSSGDDKAFEQAALAIVDPARAMLRALDFKLQLGKNEWEVLMDEICAKQVVGDLEVCANTSMVHWLIRNAFQIADDSKLDALMRPHGLPAGYGRLLSEQILITTVEAERDPSPLPKVLRGIVHGEICAEGLSNAVAIPVKADYAVTRIGRNLYGKAALLQVQQLGEHRYFDPEDEFEGGMTFGV